MEEGAKRRDLEDRTFRFAEAIRSFVKQLPRTISNVADEALSKKDFLLRVKICRKEAKESRLFLRLIDTATNSSATTRDNLATEARERVLIFSSIISKNQ
jgi:hypothetical protein